MKLDPGNAAAGGQRQGRIWARVLGVVLLGLLVTFAMLVAFPPAGLVKDRIARIVGEEIGRTVTIGDAHLAFRPDIHVELANVTLSNPQGMAGPDLFKGGVVRAKVRLWPLLQGETDLLSVDLVKPAFNLQVDASGKNNWVLERKTAGGQETGPVLPRTVTLDGGRLSYVSAKTGTSAAVDDISASTTINRGSGATQAKGRFAHKGETVNFDIALEDLRTVADARPTSITAVLEGKHGKAEVTGEALVSDTSAFAGELKGSSRSLLDFAKWLGANVAPSGEPMRVSVAGKVKATPGSVQLESTDVVINNTAARLRGNLGLAGPRPKFEGDIKTERFDLARILGTAVRQGAQPQGLAPTAGEGDVTVVPAWESLLGELQALEKGGGARGAAAQPEPLSAAPKPLWSEEPISLGALKVLDLDVTFVADQIVYGGLDLRNGRIRATVTDGSLDAKVEELEVGKGKAQGNIAIETRASPPRAAMTLIMTDVAAEPIVNEITGKPLLTGTSNVEIAVKAIGQNQRQLAETVEGKAKFRMGKGALRGYAIHGFDFWEMVTQWKKILKFDLAKKTQFERLDAQYDIRKGIMTSSPGLDVGGSEVEVNSKGDVNLPRKRITQKLRVTVLPPPTTFSLPVIISGEWARPSVGVDWSGWFSGVAPSGDLRSLAPGAEPPPPEVQAAIKRVLSANIDPTLLTEEGKAVLRAMLPPEPGSAPVEGAPPGGGEAPR